MAEKKKPAKKKAPSRVMPFLGGVATMFTIAASAVGIYFAVASANAPRNASEQDAVITAQPWSQEAGADYLLPPGTEFIHLHDFCTKANVKQLLALGHQVDPIYEVSVTNRFSGGSTGQLYLNDLHATALATHPALANATGQNCPTAGGGEELSLAVDLDKPSKAVQLLSGGQPDTKAGQPTFTLAPGETISFYVTFRAVKQDYRVRLDGTFHSGSGQSWTADLTEGVGPIYVPGTAGEIMTVSPASNAPGDNYFYFRQLPLGSPTQGHATLTRAPTSDTEFEELAQLAADQAAASG